MWLIFSSVLFCNMWLVCIIFRMLISNAPIFLHCASWSMLRALCSVLTQFSVVILCVVWLTQLSVAWRGVIVRMRATWRTESARERESTGDSFPSYASANSQYLNAHFQEKCGEDDVTDEDDVGKSTYVGFICSELRKKSFYQQVKLDTRISDM